MSETAVAPRGPRSLRVRPGHAVHRHLGEVVERVDPVVVGVVGGGAVGHLDEEAARAFEHQRQGVVRGDQVGVDGEPEEAEAVREVVLPDRLVPLEEPLAAPDVVDEDVEPARLRPDPRDERRDRLRVEVVDGDGGGTPARGRDQLGGLLDRLGAVVFGARRPRRAAGDIDRRAGGAELGGDAAAGAAGGAGDERDASGQVHGLLPWVSGRLRGPDSRVLVVTGEVNAETADPEPTREESNPGSDQSRRLSVTGPPPAAAMRAAAGRSGSLVTAMW